MYILLSRLRDYLLSHPNRNSIMFHHNLVTLMSTSIYIKIHINVYGQFLLRMILTVRCWNVGLVVQ